MIAGMKRREFITLLGGAAAAWPLAVRAQQPAMPVVGYLSARSAEADGPMLAAFRQGLADTGYVDGREVRIEIRFADGQYNRLPALMQNLIEQNKVALVRDRASHVTIIARRGTGHDNYRALGHAR